MYFTGEFILYNINSPGRILAFVKDENGNMKAKIQQLLRSHELPHNFQNSNYNSIQLWMTE
jgi:hypothetical protein